jgi:hypothetical protein
MSAAIGRETILQPAKEKIMSIQTLGAKRSRFINRAREIVDTAIRESRALKPGEEVEYDRLLGGIDEIDRTTGRTAALDARGSGGLDLVRCVRVVAESGGCDSNAVGYATQMGWTTQARALSASIGTGGGFAVPTPMAAEFIENLRPHVALRKLGVPTVPLVHGNDVTPKVEYGASVQYVLENQVINAGADYLGLVVGLPALPNASYPAGSIVRNTLTGGLYANISGAWVAVGSNPNFGQVRMTVRKLVAIVPLSNELSRFTDGHADQIVKTDLTAALGSVEDYFLLRGSGANEVPRGLRYQAASANVLTFGALAGSTPTSADIPTIDATLAMAENVLLSGNSPMLNPAWIMSTRTETALRTLRSSSGVRAYPEMDRGMLRGKPVATTNNIPTNLTATPTGGSQLTTCSEIMLLDVGDVRVGEGGLFINAAKNGTYVDAFGNTVSAFAQDQTVIRVILETDVALRHLASLAVLTAVPF